MIYQKIPLKFLRMIFIKIIHRSQYNALQTYFLMVIFNIYWLIKYENPQAKCIGVHIEKKCYLNFCQNIYL